MSAYFNRIKNRYNIRHTAESYGALLNGYATLGNIALMDKTYKEMALFNLSPAPKLLGKMLQLYLTNNQLEKAWDLIKYMEEENIGTNVLTFDDVVNICVQQN